MEDFLLILKKNYPMDDSALLRGLRPYAREIPCSAHLVPPTPEWLQQAAARWLMAQWRRERNECPSRQLLAVDRKFSRIFKHYTVAELLDWIHRD